MKAMHNHLPYSLNRRPRVSHLLLALIILLLVALAACTRTGSSGAPIAFKPTTPAPETPAAARLVAPGMPVLDSIPKRPLYTLTACHGGVPV